MNTIMKSVIDEILIPALVRVLQFQYGSIDLSHDYKQYWHLLIQWLQLNHSNNACRCKSRNAITSLPPLTPDYSSISGSPSTTARHISPAKFAHRQLPSPSSYYPPPPSSHRHHHHLPIIVPTIGP